MLTSVYSTLLVIPFLMYRWSTKLWSVHSALRTAGEQGVMNTAILRCHSALFVEQETLSVSLSGEELVIKASFLSKKVLSLYAMCAKQIEFLWSSFRDSIDKYPLHESREVYRYNPFLVELVRFC